ncbi:hypothetical protein GPECTOR_34g712 [Gonium pectorale]|uniref:Protein transport protein SEC23 n=1 Tax=Gonium pectorale TaxID=33097 RepID=A0A150GCQ3_GONPE|nr:hypothetical protein GPECTOR_34g712 [Gonium pectorale]|eukprot:KXZ47553.1 hypothetical protein GPECTOR_34g712 [Gonium pectorale]
MNVYCKTNLAKGVWKCNLCGTVNINREQLPTTDIQAYPELFSEGVEYVCRLPDGHPVLQQLPGHVVFAVDTTMDPGDLQGAKEALLSVLSSPSLPPTTRISLVTFDGCVAVHNLGTRRCAHVLPLPGAASGAAPGRVAAAAVSPAGELQATVQLLLNRHCAATVAARSPAAVAQQEGASSSCSGAANLLVGELRECSSRLPKVLASLRTVQMDAPVRERARHMCTAMEAALSLIAAHAGIDLSRQHCLYGCRVVVLTGGPATRGPGAVPLELLDQAVTEKGRGPENRTVAAALDSGVAIGSAAGKMGVPIDIFTCTVTGINAPLLTAIAHGSGGELMPQLNAQHHHHQLQRWSPEDPNGAPADAKDADARAGGGPTGGFVGKLLAKQLSVALTRRFGVEGYLDCFCSEGLRPLQWLGPLDTIRADHAYGLLPGSAGDGPSSAAGTEALSTAAAQGKAPVLAWAPDALGRGPFYLSPAACAVSAVEVGRGASLRLEVTHDLDDIPALVLQVVFQYVETSGSSQLYRVTRVVTRKIQVVESRGEFLRSVNPTAAAALLGKQAALEAKKAGAFRDCRRAEEARYAVGAALGLVGARCGEEVKAGRGLLGFGARKLRQWPPELMPLAYALYHFQRGPTLGPPSPPAPGTHPPSAHAHLHALWDSDARLAGLNALLWSSWGSAYRIMSPKLYALLPGSGGGSEGGGVQLAALPCVSLAAVMARAVPLVLDVGTAVLVSNTEEPQQRYGTAGSGVHDHCSGSLSAPLLEAAFQAMGLGALPPAEDDVAARAAHMRRFPVPSVALLPGAQEGAGALAARLIPVHRDGYEEQTMQHPQLRQLGRDVAAQLSKQLLEGAAAAAAASASAAAAAGLPLKQAKQAVAGALSFVEWCRSLNVQPFPTL